MAPLPWFYQIPLPILWVAIAVILFLCSVLGFNLGLRAKRRHPDGKVPESSNYVASSILGLLALILGFTFSMAIARFENRRKLVIDEVNAIGTTYLRVQLLRRPEKAQLSELMKQYCDARVSCYDASSSDSLGEAHCEQARSLQNQIWDVAGRALTRDRGAIESIFINSLNQMIDLEEERSIAFAKPLPEVIYWVILLISAAGILALEFGRGLRAEVGFGWSMLLVAVLSCVLVMIHDLERPKDGAIRITQDAMTSLCARLREE